MTITTREYQSAFARRYFGQGEAKALLAVLDARGVAVPDEVRADITGCTDIDQLDTWIRRAATAQNVEDLFD